MTSYKLVPVEITDEMVIVGAEDVHDTLRLFNNEILDDLHNAIEIVQHVAESCFNAMLAAAPAVEQEPVGIEFPEYYSMGMACGLEDRGITDRYEAMRYGWEEALDRMAEELDNIGPLYLHPQPAEHKPCPDTLIGRTVSVDVSTGDHNAFHRLFGTVVGVEGQSGVILCELDEDNQDKQPAPVFHDEDHVSIPRGLITAVCSAIDKKRDAENVLSELRRYTLGDLSRQTEPDVAGLVEALSRCRHQASYSIGEIEALEIQLGRVRDIANEALAAHRKGGMSNDRT